MQNFWGMQPEIWRWISYSLGIFRVKNNGFFVGVGYKIQYGIRAQNLKRKQKQLNWDPGYSPPSEKCKNFQGEVNEKNELQTY